MSHPSRRLTDLARCITVSLALGVGLACAEESQIDIAPGTVEILERTSEAFATVAEKATPAVVFIEVEKTVDVSQNRPGSYNDPFGFFGDDFMERFFGPQGRPPARRRQFRQQGAGTGFLISEDGYILSNNHVVGDADKITVTLSDGREMAAERIGTDPQSEVALIKIEGDGYDHLPLGNSSDLRVGSWVIAIGNPFGLTETVTVGVVSAKGRSNIGIADYEDFIQTDAAINPGNSGGPLLNLNGEVVGINTAIYSRSGGYMGIGFAIPINMATYVKDQLIETGKVTRSYLGVYIQPLTPELAESFDLEATDGILISQVSKDSGADEAGLKTGDVILEMNGKPVEDVGSFRNKVSSNPPGTEIELKINRDGKTRAITVTTGEFPGEEAAAASGPAAYEKLGLTVRDLTPELVERFGYEDEQGVIVSNVMRGSPAAEAGIQPGHLITSVNREAVASVAEFKAALRSGKDDDIVLLLVKDQRGARFVTLRLE